MIQVGMFATNTVSGAPVALLIYSGRGKTVKVETQNDELKEFLSTFVDKPLGLAANSIAWPEDRKVWMESLPIANHSIPYWFRIIEEQTIIEEVIDDNTEQGTEEAVEEGVEHTEDYSGSEDSSDSEGEDSS